VDFRLGSAYQATKGEGPKAKSVKYFDDQRVQLAKGAIGTIVGQAQSGKAACGLAFANDHCDNGACGLRCRNDANGRVTRFVVEKTEPFKAGKLFGAAGAYQRLEGRVILEVDPRNPLDGVITNLNIAPRNAKGMVEFSAPFTILRPVDQSKWNGKFWYAVNNRCNSDMRYLMPAPGEAGTDGNATIGEGRPKAPERPAATPVFLWRRAMATMLASSAPFVTRAPESVREGFMLEEDAQRYIEAAERGTVLRSPEEPRDPASLSQHL
jgi:hypothetical protein